MLSFFKRGLPDLYIDLGTANTLISLRGKGVVLNEPSVIAFNVAGHGRKKIVAVGSEAKEKMIRTPGNLFSERPLKDGVIADFDTTETMLRHFIQRPNVSQTMGKPRVVISVPFGVTDVEKKAVVEAGKAAGAKDVILIDEPMAAAIGAGLPVKEAKGSMLIDFGGGTTEVAIIALSDIVFCKSIRVGGHKLDESIMDFAKRKKNIIINEFTAEQLKLQIGSATPDTAQLTKTVSGRDVESGLPAEVEFTSADIALAIHDDIQEIISTIKKALENTPPELLSDIIDSGIVLTGGGSLLRDLDKRIAKEVKIPVRIADNPLITIAIGGEKLLNDADLLERVQLSLNN